MRGGARQGSGRPRSTNPSKPFTVRLSGAQRGELTLRGGSAAIKTWLDELTEAPINALVIPPLYSPHIGAFLDDLRRAGVVNMFGATPYLEDAFGLDRVAAGACLAHWMKTFHKNKTSTEK